MTPSNKNDRISKREGVFYMLFVVGLSWVVWLVLERPEGNWIVRFSRSTAIENRDLTRPTRSTENTILSSPPRAQFIFSMSILGDGSLQEQLGELIRTKSPVMKELESLGVIPTLLAELHQSLYQGGPNSWKTGLWNVHCRASQTKRSARKLQMQVVQALQAIQRAVARSSTWNAPVLPIPINLVLVSNATTETNYGMVTYPTEFAMDTDCHRLDFASLDLLYTACQIAQVDCRHVYVWEPPKYLLGHALARAATVQARSTTSRNKPYVTHLSTLHQYNTMLHVVANELVQFAPRVLGCMYHDNWKSVWGALWGLSESELDGAAVTFPCTDRSESAFWKTVPARTRPYVESFQLLHQNAADSCINSLRQVEEYLDRKEID